MRIDFVEIANFRKLLSTRVGLSPEKTVFVGANNSGKTTAITALRYFLADRERPRFCFNDFTLAHWPAINAMGDSWEAAHVANEEPPAPEWDNLVTCSRARSSLALVAFSADPSSAQAHVIANGWFTADEVLFEIPD